ncbi:MAG: Asp-tRNA(Asn)/Glu-tRNA(Gln) amidotransferase subunit GatC [Patescibacteria group bacterium]
MKLSKEEIKHIADLARLELTAEEQKKYGSQLSDVLSFVEQLREVDTTDCEPTAQVTGLENIFRADEEEDWNEREKMEALKQAPELEAQAIKVKRVLDNN